MRSEEAKYFIIYYTRSLQGNLRISQGNHGEFSGKKLWQSVGILNRSLVNFPHTVTKGGQNGGTYVSPNIEEVPFLGLERNRENTRSMMTSSNGNISALLALCTGNLPLTGEFPTQRQVSFDLRLE